MSLRFRVLRCMPATVAALCALAGCLFVSVTSASAAVTHNLVGSFGELGSGVAGLGVDESTGNIYIDGGGTVHKFSATGEPVAFSALKSNAIEGAGSGQLAVDNSAGPAKGDIYIATEAVVDIYGADGSFLGELAGPNWESAEAGGVAVDPAGHLYVENGEKQVVKYTPSGNPVTAGDYTASLEPLNSESPRRIAVDSKGDVYTTGIHNAARYDALQFGSLSPLGSEVYPQAGDVAVDAATDHAYVSANGQLIEFDSSGTQIEEPFGGELGQLGAVAVDATHDRVLTYNGSTGEIDILTGPLTVPDVVEGAPTGVTETGATLHGTVNPLGADASCEVEYGTTASYGSSAPCEPADVGSGSVAVAVKAALSGLESGTVYHYRFVAADGNGQKHGLDATFATGHVPLVDGETLVSVSETKATLQAQINSKYEATHYRFEYGPTTAYGASGPVPDGTLSASGVDQSVVWTFSGLQPGGTYHYRVVAVNSTGTTDGPDQVLKTYPAVSSAADTCPNAALRHAQFASYLPDCRAFEMVSPTEKEGANIATGAARTQSAADGEAVKFLTSTGFGDIQGSETPGSEYLSRRGAEGWTTNAINPEQESAAASIYTTPRYVGLSSDLSKGVFYAQRLIEDGHPNVASTPNLYLRGDLLAAPPGSYDLLSDAFKPVPPKPAFGEAPGIAFGGASADFSHILIETANDLTPETSALNPNVPKLYEWHDGTLKLAGILPDGTPAASSMAGHGTGGGPVGGPFALGFDDYYSYNQGAISTDGSRVVFQTRVGEDPSLRAETGNLYMRIDGSHTIQLNVSERSEFDPNGAQPAVFQGATPDDSKVFFTTRQLLTDDAQGLNEGQGGGNVINLYMYDLDAPEGKHLTDIAKRQEGVPPAPQALATRVVGISADGSYVYFMNRNVALIPGQPQFPREGGWHLYVWHDGVIRFVAEHNADNDGDPAWAGNDDTLTLGANSFRVTLDGQRAMFITATPSTAEIAGQEVPECLADSSNCRDEVYVYDYDTGKVTCASCSPVGAAPTSNASIQSRSDDVEARTLPYASNAMSEDGRYVFFDTGDALLPQDTNGRRDVYEYDTVTGRLSLLSGGTCYCNSYFADASTDGRNVFITTRQKLVQADIDADADLYDVRVEGGIPAQNRPPAARCEGDDCQGPARSAPVLSLPASSTFAGVGNAPAQSKGSLQGSPKTRALTRAQRLAAALRACRKQPKRRRPACRARARRSHGAKRSGRRASLRAGR